MVRANKDACFLSKGGWFDDEEVGAKMGCWFASCWVGDAGLVMKPLNWAAGFPVKALAVNIVGHGEKHDAHTGK